MAARTEQLRDEVDILAYRTGDIEALERLISRWQARIYSYILAMIGDRDAAWDVSQELWLSVVSRLGRGSEIGDFTPWVYRAAYNRCMSHLRKRRRDKGQVAVLDAVADEDKSSSEAASKAEDARIVRECLAELTLVLRETMALFYVDGLSINDVAGILGVPRGTVQSRLHYGRLAIRKALMKKGYGDDRS